jgi:hypothetical protein
VRGVCGVAALAVAALAAGCGKPSAPPGDPRPDVSTLAPLASTPPADHLGPDELLEGTERAFGVALPRGLTVDQRYPDTVYASGPMTVHALVLYFGPRLQGGSLRESATVATFERVSAPGLPADTELTIHLAVAVGKTTVAISATTYPPAPVLPDEASRWRQVGLTPNGKILDPTHLD